MNGTPLEEGGIDQVVEDELAVREVGAGAHEAAASAGARGRLGHLRQAGAGHGEGETERESQARGELHVDLLRGCRPLHERAAG